MNDKADALADLLALHFNLTGDAEQA